MPDELAFEYSAYSSRYPFNQRFRVADEQSKLSFIRDGRGVSFHEIELALGRDAKYRIMSDYASYISRRNPAMLAKRWLAGDGSREKLLNSYSPGVHRCFFRQQLNLIIEKQ